MTKNTPHYTGHRLRLRERLLKDGTGLADYEVLELLLGYALLRRDTKPLAKELLAKFGSIRGVLQARPEQILRIPGAGEGVNALFAMMREVLARYGEAPTQTHEVLCTPEAVAAMVIPRLSGCPQEEIWIATVDNQNRQLGWERLARGGPNTVPCQPRDILEQVFKYKATGFILVHNHPGGSISPSPQDLQFTQKLQDLAQSVSIRFLDHIIVGDGICYSIRRGGILPQTFPSANLPLAHFNKEIVS